MARKLSDYIDTMLTLRETQRELEAQIKGIKAEYEALHNELLDRLDEVGTETARGTLANVVVTELLVPRIEDWGAVEEWVLENEAVYLLHRRVSSGPWKELLDTGEEVPGITPYRKRGISLTKLRD